jgi:hypothetical protein
MCLQNYSSTKNTIISLSPPQYPLCIQLRKQIDKKEKKIKKEMFEIKLSNIKTK